MQELDSKPTILSIETPEVSAELALPQRRELARLATEAISEVLEIEVSIPRLQTVASSTRKSPARLAAKRALRCVDAIGRPNSSIVKAVGEDGLYDFVEGVIVYGASEEKFLTLIGDHGLTADEVTAVYSLRKLIAEHADDRGPGFPAMEEALKSVGMSIKQAASDPEHAIVVLDNAGYFLAYKGKKTFTQTIFSPKLGGAGDRLVEDDVDGSISRSILEGQRAQLSRPLEEIDDEGDDTVAHGVLEALRAQFRDPDDSVF